MMLLKLSWRNIWRNKRRSIIILVSIIVGIAGLLLTDAFSTGMVRQMLNNQIDGHFSHIQIFDNDYYDNKVIENRIENPDKVEQTLKLYKNIEDYSKRIEIFGLATSAANSSGVNIIAVEPEKEKKVSDIYKSITSGSYLTGKDNEIVIGNKLAEKLEVELGDKIVTVCNSVDGSVVNELFRVVGIFQSNSTEFNKTFVYVPLKNAQTMLDAGNAVTNFVIKIDDIDNASQIKESMINDLGDKYAVKDYKDMLPLLISMIKMYFQFIIVYYLIIGFAVVLGIINTTLMSVFERIQEFGVLLAIGMNRFKIFKMIITESAIIGFLGSFLGAGLGFLILLPLSSTGIDMSIFSESLASFGVGNIIYPEVGIHTIVYSLLTIPVATVVGALYPALKAVKLQPTDAMRYV